MSQREEIRKELALAESIDLIGHTEAHNAIEAEGFEVIYDIRPVFHRIDRIPFRAFVVHHPRYDHSLVALVTHDPLEEGVLIRYLPAHALYEEHEFLIDMPIMDVIARTNDSVDKRGRFIPEKYLAGLPPDLRERRKRELTASREGRYGYEPLPTDFEAQRLGLPRRSQYIEEAERRGIEHRGDFADTAVRACHYYGVSCDTKTVSQVAAELEKVFKKGLAAWQTGGHRPGASQGGWAYARVASVLVGGKAAYTADARNLDNFPTKLRDAIYAQSVYKG